ncbi:MAG: SDR family NAD(P)-dependent oxidoreductase [Bdellovibrionota bacterium]
MSVTAVIGASSELSLAAVRIMAGKSPRQFFLHFRQSTPELETVLVELGERATSFQADLEDPAQVDKLKLALLQANPACVIVAAAPPLRIRRTREIPREEWLRQFSVQTLAPALILPAILPGMAKAENSQVIFVLSEVVRHAPKGMADYVTAKFATLGLIRALQAEFNGLRIHAIAPGMMETRFIRELPEIAIEAARKNAPLLTVNECAAKLAVLVEHPDALKEDPLYLG